MLPTGGLLFIINRLKKWMTFRIIIEGQLGSAFKKDDFRWGVPLYFFIQLFKLYYLEMKCECKGRSLVVFISLVLFGLLWWWVFADVWLVR